MNKLPRYLPSAHRYTRQVKPLAPDITKPRLSQILCCRSLSTWNGILPLRIGRYTGRMIQSDLPTTVYMAFDPSKISVKQPMQVHTQAPGKSTPKQGTLILNPDDRLSAKVLQTAVGVDRRMVLLTWQVQRLKSLEQGLRYV